LTEVGISAECKLSLKTSGITIVATRDGIYRIIAQSYECPVFTFKIEKGWRNLESEFNSQVAVVSIVLPLHVGRINEHGSDDCG